MKDCQAPACAHLSNAATLAEINASLNTVSVAGHGVGGGGECTAFTFYPEKWNRGE